MRKRKEEAKWFVSNKKNDKKESISQSLYTYIFHLIFFTIFLEIKLVFTNGLSLIAKQKQKNYKP